MGTLVTIHVVVVSHMESAGAEAAVERAFGWFHQIEDTCTRFNARSELMQLTAQIGVPVPASAMLYEAVRFALTVAEESGGAFDPAIGHAIEARGFNREYRTGAVIHSPIPPCDDVSYRDVYLDPDQRTITLRRPLVLDLGAVAKGLAVDTAARELQPFRNFAIDAGGDLYLSGHNPQGAPWSVGIRHPRPDDQSADQLIDSVCVSDRAVCTSGDYERRARGGSLGNHKDGHHILDPRTGKPANLVASATVIAPSAMLADALATAAFVLGPVDGIQFLERLGVDGLIVTPELVRHETRGLRRAA